ncbi:hypothetical protein FPV67DRAFT_1099573 [Lyophyllum atratum]|nr:hypothetical protein FPV67DRAFT_1099573 [Lyophyllum atratum]
MIIRLRGVHSTVELQHLFNGASDGGLRPSNRKRFKLRELEITLLMEFKLALASDHHYTSTNKHGISGPRIQHTRKRRAIIPGFLYVTFFGIRPRFSLQFGRHVHVN